MRMKGVMRPPAAGLSTCGARRAASGAGMWAQPCGHLGPVIEQAKPAWRRAGKVRRRVLARSARAAGRRGGGEEARGGGEEARRRQQVAARSRRDGGIGVSAEEARR